jgi:transcriptional regulator with XRE-family HTH domain
MALKYSNEIYIINLYIGCKIRYERLIKNLSQHELSIKCGLDSVAIGRIERAEHMSSWPAIYIICNFLEIELCTLFSLKSKNELLDLINKCFSLESKLTKEKEKYYKNLKIKVYELLD